MTKLDDLWTVVEMWFDGIEGTVAHRCYAEHSVAGVRSIQRDIRNHLTWIDEALLEIEVQAKMAEAEQ